MITLTGTDFGSGIIRTAHIADRIQLHGGNIIWLRHNTCEGRWIGQSKLLNSEGRFLGTLCGRTGDCFPEFNAGLTGRCAVMGTSGGILSGFAGLTGQRIAVETTGASLSGLIGFTCSSEMGITGRGFALEIGGAILSRTSGLVSCSSLGNFQGQLYLTGR